MITFIKGMLVGMALAVIIAIIVDHVLNKPVAKTEIEDAIVEEPETEMTAEEKFDKFCNSIHDDIDMKYIDSIIEICKGDEFYGE